MIHYEEHRLEGYVELTVDGKVDREDFEDVVSKLGPLMDENEKVGILKRIISFSGIPPKVLWDDLKFGLRHLKHVGPVAVVSDKRYIEIWTKLARPPWSQEVQFFELDELEEARTWMSERMRELKRRTAHSS